MDAANRKMKKRAPNPYAVFVREHWRGRDDDNQSFSDFNKDLAEQWRAMSDEEKDAWRALSNQEKTKFKEQRARMAPKTPMTVKRPRTGFIFFSRDMRAQVVSEHPQYTLTMISKALGQMWSQLPPDEKARYNKKAETDRKRYFLQIGKSPTNSRRGAKSRPTNRRSALGTSKRRL